MADSEQRAAESRESDKSNFAEARDEQRRQIHEDAEDLRRIDEEEE